MSLLKSFRFKYIFLASYLFLFANILGNHLEKYENIEWVNGWQSNLLYWSIGNILGAFLLSCLIYFLFPPIVKYLKPYDFLYDKTGKNLKPEKLFVILMLLIFALWIPCELAYYPGIFDYDVLGQIPQGSIVGYSKGHPLLHTLFLNFMYKVGVGIWGSGNAGIILYTIIQMLILAGCISYAITYLYKQNVNTKICYGLGAWFAIFPTHAIMSVSTTKDVIFSGAMLVFVILIYDVAIKCNKKNIPFCVLWGCICALLRNNMIYAIVVFILIITFQKLIWKNKLQMSSFLFVACFVTVAFFVVDAGMTGLLQASEGNSIEKFSVPLQQLARTYNYNKMEESDQKLLFEFIPEEAINNYRPSLADPVKSFANAGVLSNNKEQLVNLYMKYLKRYPGTYINAFLELTRGMWHLNDTSHIWIYWSPNYLEYNCRELPTEWNMPAVKRTVKWEFGKMYYDNIARGEWVKDVPILSWLFAPAFYLWLLVAMFGYSVYKKAWNMVSWQLISILYSATLLLGPAVLVRYVYFSFLLVPFIAILSMIKYSNR